MESRLHQCDDVNMEEDIVPEIQNDCSLDTGIIPQLPHTISEILDAVTIVKKIEDSKKIICHLIDCHQIISLDIKGRDLGTGRRKISLIAVGTCNGQCLLFDIHCNNELVIKGGLKNMLECEKLIKVMHECCLIRTALEQCFGVKINSIFDTQCAHAVIEGHRCGMNPRCVSPETLLFISTSYGRGVLTPAVHALERLYLENSNFWDTRPLPCKLINFAARGVLALLPEVYNNLNRRLCGPLRQTFRTLCHGKCIEPAEHDALHVQKPSLEHSCNKTEKNRSISGDCRRKSYSLICQSSNQSDNNEARARCGSVDSTCPPKSTCQTPCVVPEFKNFVSRCVSTSDCTPNKNQNCLRKTSTKVSCNCVECTQCLAGKSCATRKHCACTAKVACCNCVERTQCLAGKSCATRKHCACNAKVASCKCGECTQCLAGKSCATRKHCACNAKVASCKCGECTQCLAGKSCATRKHCVCTAKVSSCNCVECTHCLAGKSCATRKHCVCTAKVATCNCVKCTSNVTKRSCASKKKKRNFKSKSLSNFRLSCNKSGSLSSCISPKKTGRTKSCTAANYSCSKPTPVKSKAICGKESKLKNNCHKRKFTRSKTLAGKKRRVIPCIKQKKRKCGNPCVPTRQKMTCLCKTLKTDNDLRPLCLRRKAQMYMESEMNNENEEMDEEEQNVAECNDEEEYAGVDADDEDDFESEILPSAAKRKR